jgi:2-aminoadipate transaminase
MQKIMGVNDNLVNLWEEYESKASNSGGISFAAGRSSEITSKLFSKKFSKVLSNIAHNNSLLNLATDYSPPQGLAPLRNIIAKNCHLPPEQIIVTNGAQQALNLILNTYLPADGKILMENVNYVGLQKIILNQKAKPLFFSRPLAMMEKEEIEREIKDNQPKIIYLQPDFANPTGYTMSLKIRKLIAKLAKKYKCLIIEDQTYRELVYKKDQQLPAIQDLYPSTVVIASISKSITPGLRIAWIVCPKKYFQYIYEQKKTQDIFTSSLSQLIATELLDSNFYFNHLKETRKIYEGRMTLLLDCLRKYMPKGYSWNTPNGGFFVWIEGPKDLDSSKLFRKAVRNGVAIMPGFVFYYHNQRLNSFRLSISSVSKDLIEDGIIRLSKTLKGERVAPKGYERNKTKIKKLFSNLHLHQLSKPDR